MHQASSAKPAMLSMLLMLLLACGQQHEGCVTANFRLSNIVPLTMVRNPTIYLLFYVRICEFLSAPCGHRELIACRANLCFLDVLPIGGTSSFDGLPMLLPAYGANIVYRLRLQKPKSPRRL